MVNRVNCVPLVTVDRERAYESNQCRRARGPPSRVPRAARPRSRHSMVAEEWAKLELIERRLRAAGCKLPSPAPTERWKQKWAWLINDARRQQLLPEKPPWGRLCTGADSLRLALRPDWAPPHHLPTHFVCIYAAGAPDGNAWALVAVNGHDARTDALAPLLREAGGPVILDTDAPQFAEATAHSNWQATLCAIIECLRLVLDDGFGQQPVLLRVEERWAAAVAGLTTGASAMLPSRRSASE